ncbi:MAG: putative holin-like toxin [Staphylococcus epidermidis]|nr:putative holin-like toxin [Staphylococcus epidermidis]
MTIPIWARVSDYEILSLMLEFATLIVIILTLKDKK